MFVLSNIVMWCFSKVIPAVLHTANQVKKITDWGFNLCFYKISGAIRELRKMFLKHTASLTTSNAVITEIADLQAANASVWHIESV